VRIACWRVSGVNDLRGLGRMVVRSEAFWSDLRVLGRFELSRMSDLELGLLFWLGRLVLESCVLNRVCR
jgi:hypothetical protein